MHYVGRFAPSPTGPLHLGSLTTAAASYLHARQAGGEWLVRIEDIDPPREAPGAAAAILATLERLELEWDRSVLYQSTRFAAYAEAADRLLRSGRAFRCDCSRSRLRDAGDGSPAAYPGTCRAKRLTGGDTAVRVLVEPHTESFVDGLQGPVDVDLGRTCGDYVVYRRDGLPAYHLAVVLDDAEQGVTTIVRGVDLLEQTPVHLHLQRALGVPAPRYLHVPVLVNADGQKLSKQTGAAPVSTQRPADVTALVLRLLGANAPAALGRERPSVQWRWAMEHWRIEALAGRRALRAPE